MKEPDLSSLPSKSTPGHIALSAKSSRVRNNYVEFLPVDVRALTARFRWENGH